MAKKNEESIEISYDKDGESMGYEDEKKKPVYAKFCKKTNCDIYYCLIDMHGSLFNFSTSKPMNRSNADRYLLKRVNPKCFEDYLNYLMTKNTFYYKKANRRLIENV